MNIFSHFTELALTQDQQIALEMLQEFLVSDDHVFILQGYAGSGKTTILNGLVQYIKSLNIPVNVMAPTGRAAKVLRDKTGYGKTIHSTIYNLSLLKSIEDPDNKEDVSVQYMFPIRENVDVYKIHIIDEASMVSSVLSENELYSFGTNILINDLLTHSRIPTSKNKMIFVGDPAQLPPVTDSSSKALQPEFFESLGLRCRFTTLTQVLRQKDNLILTNATKIRSLQESTTKTELTLEYDEKTFIKASGESLAQTYCNLFPNPELGDSAIISYSNAQCLAYNQTVRSRLFPGQNQLCPGDIIIIVHNNYHSYVVELMNGEMAKVVEVDPNVISRKNIPVYETIHGNRVKKEISLHFRKIKIRVNHWPNEIECLIIDSLLNSRDGDLSIAEMKALYIDFLIRFDDKQRINREKGLPVARRGSEEFSMQLQSDPFYNALRVKYGYAITCHKAQGGEWDTTFVDYFGRAGINNDSLRWAYTATTRARNTCFVVNAPNVTALSEFSIGEILPLSNIPADAISYDQVPISPFHSTHHHRAKSFKYWEIEEKLANTPYQLVKVESLSGGYQERYSISFEGQIETFDVFHNQAGIFNDFKAISQNSNEWVKEVLEILNQSIKVQYTVAYSPSIPTANKLFGIMQTVCEEAEVQITNVIEKLDNYYIMYYLKTDAKCAFIQFYMNDSKQLTRALPKSVLANEDKKLDLLLKKLRDYVI